MINKYFLAFFLATALVGCGGSGEDLSSSFNADGTGGGSGGATDQSAEGMWSGVVRKLDSDDYLPTVGIVLPTNEYYFASGNKFSSLIVGSGKTKGSTFNSTNAHNPGGYFGFTDGLITGTVSNIEKKLKPILKNPSSQQVASGELNFVDSYMYQASIDSLDGKSFKNILDDSQVISLSSKKGYDFDFDDGKCQYFGALSTQSNNKNYFQLTLTISDYGTNSCSNKTEKNSEILGYAFVKPVEQIDHLFLVGIDKQKQLSFAGAFKKSNP